MEIKGMNNEEQDIINKLLDIMKEQNMREQARNMEEVTRYIVGMQVQLAMVTNELNGIKEQLGQMQNTQQVRQNTQKGPVKAADKVTESVQQFGEKTNQLSAKVSGAKTHLVQTASKAVNAFVEKGKYAMNQVLQSGISKLRNRLQDSKVSLADTITAYANTAERINSASNELNQLKQIKNSFVDIGQILSGKDIRNLDKVSNSLNTSLGTIQSEVSKKNESMGKIDNILAKLDKISDSLNASLGTQKKEGKTEKEEAGDEKNIQESAEQAEPPMENQKQKENRESVNDAPQTEPKMTEKAGIQIYLKLPSAGKEEFKKMTAYLKENGALFDADKKAWYVTDSQDLNKFASYLPTAPEDDKSVRKTVKSPVKEAGTEKENRESIKNKLSQMKEAAEKQNEQGEPQKEKKQEVCL